MRLARRPEVGINADVQLAIAKLEPATAAPGQFAGLGDFSQPQQLAEKPPRLNLTAGRNGDLDVIEDRSAHQTVAMSGASSAFIPTTL
jgi:hypothetical protein